MATVLSETRFLNDALALLPPLKTPANWLQHLVQQGFGELPLPGGGRTIERWQALAAVSAYDLSLGKLYEGHTDALAIIAELSQGAPRPSGTWGIWAAEEPSGRALIQSSEDGRLLLRGTKSWCSGADMLDHGLLTAWFPAGLKPQLVTCDMHQAGITVDHTHWHAVGMAQSSSVDVRFADVVVEPLGGVGQYLTRPGFWQGGAGIAACWYGGAQSLGQALRRALSQAPVPWRTPFRWAALGKIDNSLRSTASVLREAATWIDAHPREDANSIALHARLTAEACAALTLNEAGRALGASAFCRDPHFARMAADLPVYVRQSHGEKDFAALGESAVQCNSSRWLL